MKKILLIIMLSVLIFSFVVINIVWLDFYEKTTALFKDASHDMSEEESEGQSSVKQYKYYDKETGIGYTLSLPKYLNFTCTVNLASTLKKSTDSDGYIKYEEDYLISSLLTLHPYKKYKYQLYITATDEKSIAEHGMSQDCFWVTKQMEVYSSTVADKDEAQEIFNNASEYVSRLHNSMVDFFGPSIKELW